MFTVGPEEDGRADPEDYSAQIAALLRERDGYINRGMGDRVTAVEAELERLGFEVVQPERAVIDKPKSQKAIR